MCMHRCKKGGNNHMKVEIVYPAMQKTSDWRRRLCSFLRVPVYLGALASVIVNLCVGGKAWSVIVVLGLYMVWTLLLSPPPAECNRISQWIHFIVCSCIMLSCIDFFLAPGWAVEVVPLVCFGGVVVSGVLFFTDFSRQRQNVFPFFFFLLLCFFASGAALLFHQRWYIVHLWPYIVLFPLTGALLLTLFALLGGAFFRELPRRFHM